MAVFGDMIEIVCNDATLGDFRFYPKANEDFTGDKGGIRNNDDANQLTASGENMVQKNRVRWSIEGIILMDVGNTDLETLSESTAEQTWTFTHISGTVWKGKGTIVGDIQHATNTGTVTLKVSGAGKLQEI